MSGRFRILYAIACEAILLGLLVFIILWQNLSNDIHPAAASGSSVSGSTRSGGTDESASGPEDEVKKDFIKWVDFNVDYEALDTAYTCDVDSHSSDTPINWIELLAYAGAKHGGEVGTKAAQDMAVLASKIMNKETTMEETAKDMKYYSYYLEAYSAVLGGLVGEYEIEVPDETAPEKKAWESRYGLKGFLPVAKYFPYSDYDDFGVSRSYGYKRRHLGHDMMGQTGTPIVAVESGYVECIGWNQYGGWRLGIRSFDGRRYYYYAHLRKNFPYNQSLQEGSVVQAGDVIGYMGRTGYSATENTNNIDETHLHFGLQLIFDESQKEGNGEIWVDCYQLIRFLYRNRCETVKDEDTKEWHRVYEIRDPAAEAYKEAHSGTP